MNLRGRISQLEQEAKKLPPAVCGVCGRKLCPPTTPTTPREAPRIFTGDHARQMKELVLKVRTEPCPGCGEVSYDVQRLDRKEQAALSQFLREARQGGLN